MEKAGKAYTNSSCDPNSSCLFLPRGWRGRNSRPAPRTAEPKREHNVVKQQVVDHGLVLIGDVGDPSRHREYHVIVRYRQQLGLALGQPFPCRRTLTLRAMPIAAGVVGDDGVRALLTTLDMAAERRRTAALDRRHHLELAKADTAGIGRTPRRPVVAEDIRDLQLRTGHCRGRLGRRLDFLAPLLSSFPGALTLWL
jgi:hypothetical protein